MAEIEQVYDRRLSCWYLECKKKAVVRLTGFGCDKTPLCIFHLVRDLAKEFGKKEKDWR